MPNTLTLPLSSTRIDSVVQDLVAAAELPVTDLSRHEFTHEYVVSSNCTGEVFERNYPADRINSWFDVLSSCLTIEFTLRAIGESLRVSLTSEDLSGVATSSSWLKEYEVEGVDVKAVINKDLLITRLDDALGTHISALFLYEDALAKRLALRRLPTLMRDGFVNEGQHAVTIVIVGRGLLQTPLVTVAGLADTSQDDFVVLPSPNASIRAWRRALALRETTCTWTAPLARTAPEAFNVTEVRGGLEATKRAMMCVCATLSVLQFCFNVRIQDDDRWVAALAGRGGSTLTFASSDAISELKTVGEPDLVAAYRLYRWAFRAESYDKIDLVGDFIREYMSIKRPEHVEELLPLSSELLETSRASYRTLRHHAFEAYIHARNEARARVQEFVDTTQQHLEALRHEVLDTTLKFSAAIIAFLTAEVLKPGIPTIVVAVGFGLALLYLILAFVFHLIPLRSQYNTARSRAEKAVNGLRELLLDQRKEILADLPPKFDLPPNMQWTPFTRWFIASFGIYLGWALLLILIFVLTVTGGSSAPHDLPSPTPTLTPTLTSSLL